MKEFRDIEVEMNERVDNFIDQVIIGNVILFVGLLVFVFFMLSTVKCEGAEINVDSYVDAIYWAEGGSDATFLYGIRSIPYETEEEARKYCYNTVYNTLVKYRELRCKTGEEELNCLARRYAPIGVDNDPNNLNANWVKNVSWFLAHPKEVVR